CPPCPGTPARTPGKGGAGRNQAPEPETVQSPGHAGQGGYRELGTRRVLLPLVHNVKRTLVPALVYPRVQEDRGRDIPAQKRALKRFTLPARDLLCCKRCGRAGDRAVPVSSKVKQHRCRTARF